MRCKLCEKEIENYSPELNRLRIDSSHEADICEGCIAKFRDWQGRIIAKLFPTRTMKKRFGGE